MPYDNIPGVGATYLDGSFKEPRSSGQPRILVLGTASSGLTNELYTVGNVRQAEDEFDAASELMQGVHELVAQGSDNVAVMRIGGRQGRVVVTDSNSETLTIVPEYRDATILDQYTLCISNDGSENRIMIYDLNNETWVFDTSEILVINEGVIEVVDSGIVLSTVGDITTPEDNPTLGALLTGDFTTVTGSISSVVATAGQDGSSISKVERYAALNTAYHLLDYRDADLLHLKGAYLDDANVTDASSVANFWKGVPVPGSTTDELGYVWQFIYRGKLYTYFTDTATHFSVSGVAATRTVNTDLVLTAQKVGAGGNNVSYQGIIGGSAISVVISEPDAESIKITVTGPNTATTAQAVTAINNALDAFELSTGVMAGDLVQASGGSGTVLTTVATVSLQNGAGGAALTHEDLTGDSIPAAVSTRWGSAVDAELREVNFGHQLASFCHKASTTWKTLFGSASFKAPAGYSRAQLADWAGELPSYTDNGTQLYIDAPTDNGSGLLGFKLLAGKSVTSAGYRSALVEGGNSTDGYAYGGFILTKGDSLPNGSDFAYGIKDTDEAVDANRKPVDIGKHIICTYPWVVHRNGWNGGSTYRGPINGSVLGRLVTVPVNEEPIGVNGLVQKITSVPKIHATQQDGLALIRATGLRFEEGVGNVIISLRTAAHPDSDYTQVSTIRSVNEHLDGLRRVAKKYLGKAFDPARIAALQAEIDGYLTAQRGAGRNQGAVASLTYTRSERILGKLNIKLRMVPPFSIQFINVEMSLAADETEL